MNGFVIIDYLLQLLAVYLSLCKNLDRKYEIYSIMHADKKCETAMEKSYYIQKFQFICFDLLYCNSEILYKETEQSISVLLIV